MEYNNRLGIKVLFLTLAVENFYTKNCDKICYIYMFTRNMVYFVTFTVKKREHMYLVEVLKSRAMEEELLSTENTSHFIHYSYPYG